MHLSEYQRLAIQTDQTRPEIDSGGIPAGPGMIVPLLGLAGEVGSLLTEYKKHLRDGTAYRIFREQIAEDLGDLLWYVASVSSRFGFDLDEIARQNLEKTEERWPGVGTRRFELYDEGFPADEQFPRRFQVRIEESRDGERAEVRCTWDGKQIGNSSPTTRTRTTATVSTTSSTSRTRSCSAGLRS